MAVSNNPNLISKMSRLAMHGLSKDALSRFHKASKKPYEVIDIGYKMNMTDIQSSIGLVQLSRIKEMRQKRMQIWDYYNENLKDTSLILPSLPKTNRDVHALHLYSISLPENINRDEFVWKASKDFGITFGIHYKLIPSFSAYKSYFPRNTIESLYPNALDWGKRTISLSLSASVEFQDCQRIIECIKSLL